jgi:hypothetical protein
MQFVCAGCGDSFASLQRHLSNSPLCALTHEELPAPEPVKKSSFDFLEENTSNGELLRARVGVGIAQVFLRHKLHEVALRDVVAMTKASVRAGCYDAAQGLLQHVSKYGDISLESVDSIIEETLSGLDNLGTARLQQNFLQQALAYPQVIKIDLGQIASTYKDADGNDVCFKETTSHIAVLPVIEVVEKLLNDEVVGAHILELSDLLSSGTKNWGEPVTIRDTVDATNFMEHQALLEPPEEGEIVVPLDVGMDDVEPDNPIGVARGKHKVCVVTGKLHGIPSQIRTHHKYMVPIALARASDVKHFGPTLVFSGCDANMEPIPGMEMAPLQQVNNKRFYANVRGEQRPVRLVLVNIIADTLQHGTIGYECTSSAASLPCRSCDFAQYTTDAHGPFSFLQPHVYARG